jgi:PHD/YefM family antitoxin component YafN of YafNO toxin-antitoxin module
METITIKSDKPVVLIPIDEYESMKETIEFLSSQPDLPKKLRKIRKEMDKGNFITFNELKKQLI